jgi:bifunctional UDP-N-acetylglucosamine pyrophosphorylase/glucosamine-1-phosphate N-acetyltransferase
MEMCGVGALILAAGKGTRMKGRIPKVLQPLLGEPMLFYVLEAVRKAGIKHVGVVVGHGGDQVALYLREHYPDVAVIWQEEQLGTGHAVQVARPWWSSLDSLLVLCGDTPLVKPALFETFTEAMTQESVASGLVSFTARDPKGYGRVFCEDNALFVVEHKDATPEQRCCAEVDSGIYFFQSSCLDEALGSLTTANAQGEYYLPDVIGWCSQKGLGARAFSWDSEEDMLGINDPLQLAQAGEIMRRRILERCMLEQGLKCMDMNSLWIGPRVTFEEDVFLDGDIRILGESSLARGCTVGKGCVISHSHVGEECCLNPYVVLEESVLERRAMLGPFAYVRGGARIGEEAFVGKFVEIKKSSIGARSKVPHLSYVGDASVGENTNIGAGCITCNYDGKEKHATSIGGNCFIGSDTMLVAPVTVGDNAVTAAGSVITADIPEGALGVARARQRNIEGWHQRKALQKPKEES